MKNWEIAQDRGWRAVSAQPQRTLTRYSHSFSSKFNNVITAESSNIRTCFFWGPIYKIDNFSAGEELGGSHRCWGRFFGRTSPLYNCRSSQCSAFCSPFGIEPMTSPLYNCRSSFRKCRLWLIVNNQNKVQTLIVRKIEQDNKQTGKVIWQLAVSNHKIQ